MKTHERYIVISVFGVLVFAWLGFLLHVAPRFAGSGLGAVFGISGAALMVVPLMYVLVKRLPFLKERIAKVISLQSWLLVHIYAGIFGALLALIHTGHKYSSPLGIALTGAMLLVVVSGIVLRYLTPFVNLDRKDKLLLLQTARGDLDEAWGQGETGKKSPGLDDRVGRVALLAESVADLEYSIRTDELLRRWFSRALKLHVAVSVAFYALLAGHIASEIYFGLRWIQ